MRALILAAGLALIPAAPVAAQSDDRGMLTRFLEDNLSAEGRQVTIEGFAGALSSRATVDRIVIADARGPWLTLTDVVLDWNRTAVLRGEIAVNALTAGRIALDRLPLPAPGQPPSPEARGFALPDLPVSVDIRRVEAQELQLGAAVLGQPVTATLRAALRLGGGEGQLSLQALRIDDGPAGQLRLEAGYANATRGLALDLTAEEAPGGLAATLLGLPGAPATRLALQGTGPFTAYAATLALQTDGVDRLAGRLTLRDQGAGVLAFDADLGGDPAPLFLPDYAEFFGSDVRLAVQGRRLAGGELDLTRADLATAALRLTGAARIARDGLPLRLDLTGRIARADGAAVLLPLPGAPTRLDRADLRLAYDAARDEGWTAAAAVTGLDRADGTADRLDLTASGRIARVTGAPVVGATLEATATGLAPADPALARALGDHLGAGAKLSWRQGEPLRLSDLRLTGGDWTLATAGRLGSLAEGLPFDGQLDLKAQDLARFSDLAERPLGGAVAARATGRITPLAGTLDLDASLTGTALTLDVAEADRLLAGRSTIDLSVRRDGAGTALRRLTLAAGGLTAEASGRIATTATDLTGQVAMADLSVLGPRYRGALAGGFTLTGALDSLAAQLTAEARDLTLGQPEVDRLLRGATALDIGLRRTPAGLAVDRATLTNPALAVTASGTQDGARRSLTLQARLADLGLILPDFPGAFTLAGTASDDGSGPQIDLTGQGPGQIELRLTGRLDPDLSGGDLALQGGAQAALLAPLLRPNDLRGRLRFDLRLQGALTPGAVTGEVALTDGQMVLPLQNIALDGLAATARLAGGRAQLSAEAGLRAGGRVALSGGLGLMPPFDADLALRLMGAILRDPALYETRASGEVTLRGPAAGGARIGGRILLPETELRIPSAGFAAGGALQDLRHINEPAAVRATRARAGLLQAPSGNGGGSARPYALDLTIDAPNRMFLRGRGLDAELGGSLRVLGTTDDVRAEGQLGLIRGRLDILGTRLTLTEAEARLEGDLDPWLRVVAATQADGITARVVIEGRATEPEVRFDSSPELPQEEVIARILFGQGLENLSAFQAAQLASAVATLAGRGGEGVVSRLRQSFDLDDLDVVTDDSGSASVRAGKYLSRTVYTEVIVGSGDSSQINLNLDLTDSVTIRGRASSDGDTGLGIFLERDY
ncbi:MAG: translocation/assembly module TamB domain-containing protein [Rhodobacterales bacterium]|nr:translocation/assembly module TamB domain-containing protein [Rhodobacterales bacterium]